MWDIDNTGIDKDCLRRYIEEQIYTLPGTERHRDEFSVVLTGSRAYGMFAPSSDVDIDVLCPKAVYDSVHMASLEAGLIKSPAYFFVCLDPALRDSYFGETVGGPHFSLTPLEEVERQFREFDDVALWIWTNTRTIEDPDGQFGRIRDSFQGYPMDVLVRKIKYRWLLNGYWAVDGYPGSHHGDAELLAGATSVMNCVNDLLRVFYLVEGRPFPYMEKMMPLAHTTNLGKEWGPLLQRCVDLVVGKAEPHLGPWERLELAITPFRYQDKDTEGERLCVACEEAMRQAGVEPEWVAADYDNVDELLLGKLGPPP